MRIRDGGSVHETGNTAATCRVGLNYVHGLSGNHFAEVHGGPAVLAGGDVHTGRGSVAEEMKPGKEVVAGVSTFETLVKLSRREQGRYEQVRERIRTERPEMWESVKNVALKPPSRPTEGPASIDSMESR